MSLPFGFNDFTGNPYADEFDGNMEDVESEESDNSRSGTSSSSEDKLSAYREVAKTVDKDFFVETRNVSYRDKITDELFLISRFNEAISNASSSTSVGPSIGNNGESGKFFLLSVYAQGHYNVSNRQ